MTRCDMPPGPEAVECEAWAAAQEVVSVLPDALTVWSCLGVFAAFIYGFARVQARP